MKRIKRSFQKCIAGLLALITIVGILPGSFAVGSVSALSEEPVVYENYLDGWYVGIMWSTLQPDYEWNATTNEKRQPKLYVTYRTANADRDYGPGELTFTITGIGNAVRGTIVQASDVAADYGAPNPNSNNKWWYTWDPITDTYTFHNKSEIKTDESVSGGFEMLWTFNARDNTTDYWDTVEATFGVKSENPDRDGNPIDETIYLPPLNYHFTSITDDYYIDMEESPLSPEQWEMADQDYVWYDINTRIYMQVIRSRGLYESSYFVTIDLPEDAVPGVDFVIQDSAGNDISSKLKWDEESGKWGFYLFEERSGDLCDLGKYSNFRFRLGLRNEYKNEHLVAGEKVTVHGHLDRLYLDEGSNWTTENKQNHYPDRFDYKAQDEVDDEIQLSFDGYDYESDGYIYDLDKDGPYSAANEGRNQPTNYRDRLRAQNIYGDGITLQYTLYGVAQRHWATGASLYASANGITPMAGGISGIQDDTVWAMILGDDKLAIKLTDGSIRNLDDSEYDMSYVRVSANKTYGGAKKYDVFYATEQDTPFEEYMKLEGDWDTSVTRTITLPAGAKAVFVRFNDLVGTYRQFVNIGVNLHLDEERLPEFGSGAAPDHEDFFVNFSYMRAMYTPEGADEEIDDAPNSAYLFSYGEDLRNRDLDTYGETLFRDYAKSWLRTDIVTIGTTVDIRPFENKAERDYYDTTIRATGSVSADNEGELKKFSLYVVLPKGVHVDWNTVSFPFTGSGSFTAGDDPVDFNQYVSISSGSYDGCDMIVFDFDFSNSPLEISAGTSFAVEFPAYLRYSDFAMLGSRYTTYSYVELHDQGIDKLVGSNLITDTGDIDGDGDLTERLARDTDYEDVDDSARQWSARPFKYVKSEYSDGYVQDTVVQRFHSETWEEPISGCYYSYRLDFTASSVARNIVFYDMLESGAAIQEGSSLEHYDSQWQGSFLGADLSRVRDLGGTATVYYSEDPEQPWVQPKAGTTTGGWKEWTEDIDPALVKAIAIDVDLTMLPNEGLDPGTLLYVEVKMLAPSDKAFLNKTAVNQFDVFYSGYDPATKREERDTLASNMTTVTLLETIGKLVLQKIDADNATKQNAVLTGGKFMVYDEDMNPLFDSPVSPNAMGRIIVGNIPFGTYYVEEIEAPKGYQKATGMWTFEVKDENTDASIIYDLDNRRIPGEVFLTKTDAQYPEDYGPLSGAKFELYTANGIRVFAESNGDGSYAYAESGTVGEFVTGADGTLHITDLPWGSYYFIETEAPAGYQDPDPDKKIFFTVDATRYEASENPEQDGRIAARLNVENDEKLQSIRLVKLDSADGNPLAGATFSLYRKASGGETRDTLIAELLQSDQLGRIVVSDLGFGSYYFVETRNAAGYDMPAEPRTGEVTLGPDTIDTVIDDLTIRFTNDRLKGRAELTKTDDFDQYVEGVEYELFYKAQDAEDFVSVGRYATDEDGILRVYELEWGEYYFVEVSAPQGWAVDDKHWSFTVDQNNVSNLISLSVEDERARGSIKLKKVDKEKEEILLPGAEYELYTSAGVKLTPGVDYTVDGSTDNRIVTGADGTVRIDGLKQGSYYLREIVAPEGYSLSGDYIRFSIGLGTSGDVVQEIIARDEKGKAVIVVNKEVNEVYAEFGNPTFIFTVTDACGDPDCGNPGRVYTKSITLSELHLSGSVSFTVDAGHIYVIREMIAARYQLDGVGTAGEKNIDSVDKDAQTATTVKLTGDAGLDRAEVTYVNKLTRYDKLSHTDSAANMVKARSRLTAITAEFIGPNPITDASVRINGRYVKQYDPDTENYTFDEEVLTVTAYYDDGSSRVLSWEELGLDEFTLSEWFIPGATPDPFHTIHVTYTENGVTCTDQFQVETELTYAPRYTLVLNCNGGSILPDENWANGGSTTAYVSSVEKTNLKLPVTVTLPATAAEKHNRDFAGWTLEKYDDSLAPEGVKIYESLEEFLLNQAIADRYAKDNTVTLYAYYVGYTVKYAVRIYGIQEDVDSDGNLAGLTFGPAGGADYRNSFEAHLSSSEAASGKRCIHWMEWEDIIAQSKKDPTVFRDCLEYGCTHSVELRIKGDIAGTSYAGKMENGDGVSALTFSIKTAFRFWQNQSGSSAGWNDTVVRNTLNGVDTANSLGLDESSALIAMLPEELQESITAKRVRAYTAYDGGLKDLGITYDKLWLVAITEYTPTASEKSIAEGDLYSGQSFRSSAQRSLYNERGETQNAWSRTISSASQISGLTSGSAALGNRTAGGQGIAFGFCLPGPYTAKYAVRIYGIEEDVDEYGDTVGLTMGPATGLKDAGFVNGYRCHLEDENYFGDPNALCIHNMTWDEIIAQSETDPTVFAACRDYGCTHSVYLHISGSLKATDYNGRMDNGDGASALVGSINSTYRSWGITSIGGWPEARMRNLLNGVTTANGTTFDESNALIAMFPPMLRDGIVAKAVRSDTVYNDLVGSTAITYDKLWLLSNIEYAATNSSQGTSTIRPNEGHTYSGQLALGLTASSDAARFRNETDYLTDTWFRSLHCQKSKPEETPSYVCRFKSYNYQDSVNRNGIYGTVLSYEDGISPCFCLPGPHTGESAP